MLKISAYPAPQGQPPEEAAPQPAAVPQAQGQPPYNVPAPKPPSMWHAFKGGLESANRYKRPGLSAQEWADMKLTRQQWLAQYPGTGPRDYYDWRESLRRRSKPRQNNWLQNAMWPLNKLVPQVAR